jgi:hypothetical protein
MMTLRLVVSIAGVSLCKAGFLFHLSGIDYVMRGIGWRSMAVAAL